MQNELFVKLGLRIQEFQRGLNQSMSQLERFGSKAESIGGNMSLWLSAPMSFAAKKVIDSSASMEEAISRVEVSFGDSAASVREFAKTTTDSFGMSERSALTMTGLFGDMATGMGFTKSAAAEMSKTITGLAGDLASFKDIPIEQAQTALNSIFTGETESLKMLGIVMTEANLQAFAYTQGINKKVQAMSEAEKVTLRYNFVLARSKNAIGDYARTSDGATNAMRTASQSIDDAAASLDDVLNPIVAKVAGSIAQLAQGFKGLDNSTKTMILGLGAAAIAMPPIIYGVGLLTSALAGLSVAMALTTAGITLLAAGLAGLGIQAALHKSQMDGLVKSTDAFKNASKKAADQTKEERERVEALVTSVTWAKQGTEEYVKAKESLVKLSPEFASALSGERVEVDKLTTASANYVKGLTRVIEAEMLLADYRKNQEQKKQFSEDPNMGVDLVTRELAGATTKFMTSGNPLLRSFGQMFQGSFADFADQRRNLQDEIFKTQFELKRRLTELGVSLYQSTKKDVGTAIPKGLEEAKKRIPTAVNSFGRSLKKAFESLRPMLTDVFDSISNPRAEQVGILSGLANQLGVDLENIESFGRSLQDRINTISAGIKNAGDSFAGNMSEVMTKLIDAENALQSEIKNFVKNLESMGAELGSGVIEGIFTKAFGGEFNWKQMFAGLLRALSQGMIAIGKKMIALGIAMNIAAPGSGIGQIAAGIGLLAAAGAAGAGANILSQRSAAGQVGGNMNNAPSFNFNGQLTAKGSDLVAVFNETNNQFGR